MIGRLPALLTGCWLAVVDPAAPSDVAPREERVGRPTVPITVAVDGPEGAATEALLGEYLRGLAVTPTLRRVAGFELREIVVPPADPPPALARVWILADGERVSTFIVDKAWERVYIRHLELPSGLDEVAREQLATIVFTNIESLLAGGVIGVQRAEAADAMGVHVPPESPTSPLNSPGTKPPTPPELEPPSAEPPLETPPPTSRTSRGGSVGAGYGLRVWSSEAPPQHGPRLDGRLILRPSRARAPDVLLGVELAYFAPTRVHGVDIDMRIQSLASRILAGVRGRVGRGVAGRVHVAVGAEATHDQPIANSEIVTVTTSKWRALLSLSVGLGLEIALGRGMLLGVTPALEILPRRVRYVREDTQAVVFSPWIPRPGVTLELRWDSPLLAR